MNQLVNPKKQLQQYFDTNRGQLENALPRHLTPDRMARLAMTCFSQNKALAKCDPKTIFASIIVASQLGLEVGVNGQAYLVPYGQTCTLIPGWQGYVDLVSRSGRASVWTGAVYENDVFDYELGSNPHVMHKPGEGEEQGKLTHVYAIGEVKGSTRQIIEVWPINKVLRHRDKYNKVGKRHYSFENLEMYARKVPLLQVIKYLPKSIEHIHDALNVDLHASEGKSASFIDGDFSIDQPEPEAAPVAEPSESELITPAQIGLLMGQLSGAGKKESDLLAAFGLKSLAHMNSLQLLDARDWINQ